jgi:transcriptional regulator with XRE-family HTH domain
MSKHPHFAERLRVAMAKLDWSGADLARALGISRASTNPWLRGEAEPPPKQMMAAARALGVDVSWLVSPYPVDLHGPATDHMRDTLVGLFVAGVLSEGQTARATGLDRVEVRRRAHQRIDELYGECPIEIGEAKTDAV